jgi:hypothetical protein
MSENCLLSSTFFLLLLLSFYFLNIFIKQAHIFFGDVVATNEMMEKVEFSFFTLPDSGCFLTHAPSRLSEFFALLYPFHANVYPPLAITIVTTGPILYLLIAAHAKMREKQTKSKKASLTSFHDIIYIREMYGGKKMVGITTSKRRNNPMTKRLEHQQRKHFRLKKKNNMKLTEDEKMKITTTDGLLTRCVWFTCHVFLRQCKYRES